ncbi:MAG TPA: 4Fe-4S dicluster domain-containing protein, partial [Symbiobacteriaceae bacterium]|nr:4Fe-4S dicluster domain-containing protein [Symbiobacteriaceae bacterium]
PACARACPAGAISITDMGTVLSADEEKCVGCRNCTLACPFGIPKFDFNENIMYKCDLCHERTSQGSAPMCASVCPARTIQWIELDEAMEKRRLKIAAKIVGDFPVPDEEQVDTRVVTLGGFGGTGV